jgi:carbon storage regulator
MLVLSRKSNESIVIDGKIEIMIVAIQGQCVKLGIEAPSSVPVHRLEVQQRIAYENTLPSKKRNKAEYGAAPLHAVAGRAKK